MNAEITKTAASLRYRFKSEFHDPPVAWAMSGDTLKALAGEWNLLPKDPDAPTDMEGRPVNYPLPMLFGIPILTNDSMQLGTVAIGNRTDMRYASSADSGINP